MTKSPAYKVCSRCGERKHETEFSKNQYRKNNVIVRRAYCKTCEKKKKPLSAKSRRAYEEVHPRPKVGEPFTCPVCERTFVPWHKNQICLDHNHETGEIRGYLCGDCNASIGRMGENVRTLRRAIHWLLGKIQQYILH